MDALAATSLLRGRVYDMQQNRIKAALWYQDALRRDVKCYEGSVPVGCGAVHYEQHLTISSTSFLQSLAPASTSTTTSTSVHEHQHA